MGETVKIDPPKQVQVTETRDKSIEFAKIEGQEYREGHWWLKLEKRVKIVEEEA